MIIVGARKRNIGYFYIFAFPKTDGHQMQTVFAAYPYGVAVHRIAVFAAGIHASYRSSAGNADIFHIVALKQRIVVAGGRQRPVDAGNGHIVPERGLIGIILDAGRLPQHRTLFYSQLHIILKLYVGCDIPSAVEGIVPGHDNRSAACRRNRVYRLLNGFCIVGIGIALRAEFLIGNINRPIGQVKGIGVFGKVAPVLHHKAVGYLYSVHLCKKQRGQPGHLFSLERHGYCKSAAGYLCACNGLKPCKALGVIHRIQLVEEYLLALKLFRRASLHHNIVFIRRAVGYFPGIIIEFLFSFKGYGFNCNTAARRPYRLYTETAQIAFGPGNTGKIEKAGMPFAVRRHIKNAGFFLVIGSVLSGCKIYAEFVRPGFIAQAHEYRVLYRHLRAVRRSLVRPYYRGFKISLPVQRVHKRAAGIAHASVFSLKALHGGFFREFKIVFHRILLFVVAWRNLHLAEGNVLKLYVRVIALNIAGAARHFVIGGIAPRRYEGAVNIQLHAAHIKYYHEVMPCVLFKLHAFAVARLFVNAVAQPPYSRKIRFCVVFKKILYISAFVGCAHIGIVIPGDFFDINIKFKAIAARSAF